MQVLSEERHLCLPLVDEVLSPSLVGKLFASRVNGGGEGVRTLDSHDFNVPLLLLLKLLNSLLDLLHLHSQHLRLVVNLRLKVLLISPIVQVLILVANLHLPLHSRLPQSNLLVVLP